MRQSHSTLPAASVAGGNARIRSIVDLTIRSSCSTWERVAGAPENGGLTQDVPMRSSSPLSSEAVTAGVTASARWGRIGRNASKLWANSVRKASAPAASWDVHDIAR